MKATIMAVLFLASATANAGFLWDTRDSDDSPQVVEKTYFWND